MLKFKLGCYIYQTIPKDGIDSRHHPHAALSGMHGYKRVTKDKASGFLCNSSKLKALAKTLALPG